MRPCAPARDTANGLNADSARMIARIKFGSSLYSAAASAIASLYAIVAGSARKYSDVDTKPSDVLTWMSGDFGGWLGSDIANMPNMQPAQRAFPARGPPPVCEAALVVPAVVAVPAVVVSQSENIAERHVTT